MSQLGFRKSQAKVLRNIATRMHQQGHEGEVIDIVRSAAAAAQAGQPLAVPPGQGETVADALVRFGAARPAVS